MITIFTTKALSPKQFDLLVKSKSKVKMVHKFNGADTSNAINNRILNSLKAKEQPRSKITGRFLKPLPKPAQVENNPLVMFTYHKDQTSYGQLHTVRLISANSKYYTGLDLIDMNANKWQYKKFLANKAKNFQVVSFNEKAMS